MKHYQLWENCMIMIERRDIQGAEKYGKESALQLGVPQILIDKILSVNMTAYENKIKTYMPMAIEKAKNTNAKAICLYYSLDNGWDSTIYICKNYANESSSWISESRDWIDIGKARGFSGIFKNDAQSSFFADDLSSGICLLVMLKTTIAFYNSVEDYKNCGIKLCITATDSDFVDIF